MLFISGFRNKAGKKNYLSKRTNLLSYLDYSHDRCAQFQNTELQHEPDKRQNLPTRNACLKLRRSLMLMTFGKAGG